METRQGNAIESLRSAQSFIAAHAPALGAVPTSGASAQLDAIITTLDGHVGSQTGNTLAAQGATQQHISLRTALLRDHMAPIAKIAAADLPNTPAIEPLRMPKGRPTPERLRALAMGMASGAAPYTSVFVAAGLPADFIAQLTAAADATVQSVGARKQNRAAVGGATAGLKSTITKGRKIVHALDAMVRSALKNDQSALAAWNIAKRATRTAITSAAKTTTVPTTTTTAETTATTAKTATTTPPSVTTPATTTAPAAASPPAFASEPAAAPSITSGASAAA